MTRLLSICGMALTLLHTALGADFPSNRLGGDLLLDIGGGAEAEHLGYGWSRPERRGATRFRWIKRLEADVLFDWNHPGDDADLWVRAAPLYLAYRRQNIGVFVNNEFLVEWVCPDEPDYNDFHVRVPGALLTQGENRLTFRMGYKSRIGNDERALALAVDKVLLRPRSR